MAEHTQTAGTVVGLQDRYAPSNACFGCGPANAQGLQIKSIPLNDSETEAIKSMR